MTAVSIALGSDDLAATKAACTYDAEKCLEAGRALLEDGQAPKAVRWLRRGCRRDWVDACAEPGLLYWFGTDGVAADHERGGELLVDACVDRHGASCLLLGEHAAGAGVVGGENVEGGGGAAGAGLGGVSAEVADRPSRGTNAS